MVLARRIATKMSVVIPTLIGIIALRESVSILKDRVYSYSVPAFFRRISFRYSWMAFGDVM